jgi:hypothetical protein
VDGKKKDIADQNQVTSAIRLQVKKVILETNKFRRLDLGSGLGYYAVTRIKSAEMITKSLKEPVKTRPKTFF